MKKVLSVFLAVLMLCGAFSVSSFAANNYDYNAPAGGWFGEPGSGRPARPDQTILVFNINGGTINSPIRVYDVATGAFTSTTGVTGYYVMVPDNNNNPASFMTAGTTVSLPTVTPPTGYNFVGWYCELDKNVCAGGWNWTIPVNAINTEVSFQATFTPAEIEEPTLNKVLGIMVKIFGVILGLLMFGGDSAAGAEALEKLLGGVLG